MPLAKSPFTKYFSPIALVKILPASRLLKKLYVDAPITEGQVLFPSLLGEKIIATASVEKAE